MLGTATTGHATTSPADLVMGVRVPTAHQITVEHSFETAHRLPHLGGKHTSLHARPSTSPLMQLLPTGGPR